MRAICLMLSSITLGYGCMLDTYPSPEAIRSAQTKRTEQAALKQQVVVDAGQAQDESLQADD